MQAHCAYSFYWMSIAQNGWNSLIQGSVENRLVPWTLVIFAGAKLVQCNPSFICNKCCHLTFSFIFDGVLGNWLNSCFKPRGFYLPRLQRQLVPNFDSPVPRDGDKKISGHLDHGDVLLVAFQGPRLRQRSPLPSQPQLELSDHQGLVVHRYGCKMKVNEHYWLKMWWTCQS